MQLRANQRGGEFSTAVEKIVENSRAKTGANILPWIVVRWMRIEPRHAPIVSTHHTEREAETDARAWCAGDPTRRAAVARVVREYPSMTEYSRGMIHGAALVALCALVGAAIVAIARAVLA